MTAPTGNEPDSTYVIRTGRPALERLELIARLFWPSTEALLGRCGVLGPGRFLDVGCGIGDVTCRVAGRGSAATGVDVNDTVVQGAVERARALGVEVEFRVAAVSDLGTRAEYSDFDAVFARCLVSHLPDPGAAIASMVAALRPGGSVVLEDVDVSAVWSSPPSPALARHVSLYVAAATGLGAHPDVGAHLARLVGEAGATDVSVDLVQPVLRAPEDLRIHARTMDAIAGPVVAQGLAGREEVADLVAALDDFAATPGVVATLPRIVQVHARAPGG